MGSSGKNLVPLAEDTLFKPIYFLASERSSLPVYSGTGFLGIYAKMVLGLKKG
jgi:hypothetical protein